MSGALPPEMVARLGRLRLTGRRRVEGRYAGAHLSRRHGSSLDFADYREYVAGDDPRRIDVNAHARLGKRLVKLFEAEDEAALRVVVDASASMRFGGKARLALQVATGLAVVANGGGDRVRVRLAGAQGDPGPWYRGGAAIPALTARLAAVDATGRADLPVALRRAIGEGPRGPAVLVSDLMDERWEQAVDALSLGRGDTCLIHVLGREELEPDIDGDVRLVDAETGAEVEVGAGADALRDYRRTVQAWLAQVAAACASRGVAYVRVVDDEPLEDVFLTRLPRTGLVA